MRFKKALIISFVAKVNRNTASYYPFRICGSLEIAASGERIKRNYAIKTIA